MQTAIQSRSYIIGKDMLDAYLYRPLEQISFSSPAPRFERLDSTGAWAGQADVLLHEGADTSYLLETPSSLVGATAFFVPFSYLRDGESEPASLLSHQRPSTFYLFYAPVTSDGSAFHALMVSWLRIMNVLDKLGYTRMNLGMRDTLIRRAGKTGMYQSVSPDIWFYYNAERASKPISMGFNVKLLSKIATAELVCQDGVLNGHWVQQKVGTGWIPKS